MKWISYPPSKRLFQVRILAGAQKYERQRVCAPEQANCLACVQDSKAAAIFCQQAKWRGGVEKILSDGEKLFVTESWKTSILYQDSKDFSLPRVRGRKVPATVVENPGELFT